MITIYWFIPDEIVNLTNYDKIRIYRSQSEQDGYTLLTTIGSKVSGNWVVKYDDNDPDASTDKFYLVKFFDSQANYETSYYLTFFELTPRELRLVDQLNSWLPNIMAKITTKNDLRTSIYSGLYTFNIYPPLTYFSINTFPYSYEPVLVMGSQIFVIFSKYLPIAIKDFSYSDMGLTLNIDRGDRIKKAKEDIMGLYNQILGLTKMNFMDMGVGIGTLQLPISIGANLNRGLL